jgi:ketosteroid isomerase-like protein
MKGGPSPPRDTGRAMSQENVEIVRRVYEELSAHHVWEASPDLFDPEFALDLTDAYPDLGVILGLEAAEAALRGYIGTFDDFRVELREVIHADERLVVTAARDGGRLKGSDAEVWNDFFHVWTFHNGKVTRRSSHGKRSQALEAAGLRE